MTIPLVISFSLAVLIGLLCVVVMLYFVVPSWKRFGKAVAWGFTGSRYRLTRGGSSSFYFDLDVPAMDPHLARALARWYSDRVADIQRECSKPIRRIAFIEKDSGPVGALAMASLIVERTGIPGVIVRVRRRIPANAFKEKLPLHRGDAVVVITDVVTSGGSLLLPIAMLRRQGADVVGAVALIFRGDSIVESSLRSDGVKLVYSANVRRKEELQEGVLGEFYTRVTRQGEEEYRHGETVR